MRPHVGLVHTSKTDQFLAVHIRGRAGRTLCTFPDSWLATAKQSLTVYIGLWVDLGCTSGILLQFVDVEGPTPSQAVRIFVRYWHSEQCSLIIAMLEFLLEGLKSLAEWAAGGGAKFAIVGALRDKY